MMMGLKSNVAASKINHVPMSPHPTPNTTIQLSQEHNLDSFIVDLVKSFNSINS
jgi:hypothetical protein